MKGQAVSDLYLLRDKLGRGQKWVPRPRSRGIIMYRVSQIRGTLRVGSHSNQ